MAVCFRAVGEGTGQSRDIDLHDDYYEQLFVWNPASHELVGGYRIGPVDAIRRRFGTGEPETAQTETTPHE